jgi:LPS-assembly protein
MTLNAATYRLDTAALGSGTPASSSPDNLSRTIPTLSVDGGLNFDRPWTFSNRSLVQTLEPRFVYVNTPMRDQRSLPNFDAAAKEFNSTSIFSENAFSGIDRVSDAHQVTMGMTTRSLDSRSGAELLRGSIAQRVQFRDQTTTPAGTVSNQRLSDVLLAATVGLSPFWGLDSTVQYSPEISRTTRSVLTMRYQPRLDTTVMVSYRFARELAETVELRANWPLWRRMTGAGGNDCSLLVTGASRLNYNTRDSRLADSLAGLEMDAGCWIMRMGVQRQSTGVAEVTTRLIFQLELSGLTRSRANPLRF